MGKVQRLSHQQIKQAIKRDELRDFLGDVQEWVRGHVENVIIGSVLLAVVAFGISYLLGSRREDGLKASLQLAAADNQFQRALSGPAGAQAYAAAEAAYQGVKAEFGSKPEGLRAELGLANVEFETGKFEEARASFERFAAEHPGDLLLSVALAGEAASLEGLNRAQAAAELYVSIQKNYPQAPNAVPCLFEAARLYDALGQKQRVGEIAALLSSLKAGAQLPDLFKSRLALLKAKAA